MKRVLVTGLSGFIGRHLVPFLTDRGFDVHGIGRHDRPSTLDGKLTWRALDLFDHAATAEFVRVLAPTHCLNLAWYVEHGKFWRSPQNLPCVQAALNLIDAFAIAGGKRFVGAGSCAEYDWSHGVLSEQSTPRTPSTPFGHYKNAAFEATTAHGEATGISTAWGRVFFLYGPGETETRLVPHVIKSLRAGQVAKVTHGEQLRDFSYVADVAAAFAALLDSDIKGGVNIASGERVALKDIVGRIAERIGRADLIRFGAIPPQADDPPLLVADIRRLSHEVGFKRRWTLDSGLDATIASYR